MSKSGIVIKHYQNALVDKQKADLQKMLENNPRLIKDMIEEAMGESRNESEREMNRVKVEEEQVGGLSKKIATPKAKEPRRSPRKAAAVPPAVVAAIAAAGVPWVAEAASPVTPAAEAVAEARDEILTKIDNLKQRGVEKAGLKKLGHAELTAVAAAYLIGYDSECWMEFDVLRGVLKEFFRSWMISGIVASDYRLEDMEMHIKRNLKNEIEEQVQRTGIKCSAVRMNLLVFFRHVCRDSN